MRICEPKEPKLLLAVIYLSNCKLVLVQDSPKGNIPKRDSPKGDIPFPHSPSSRLFPSHDSCKQWFGNLNLPIEPSSPSARAADRVAEN